jgi:adenylyltransferase/sulfurtransferase
MKKQISINLKGIKDDRYSRLRLIPWWNQELLKKAKILVVGAGAIGNEVLKNLALLGFGNIFVVDMDEVENSNLSRSILFREEDEGKPKAVVAEKRIKEINPDVKVKGFQADICNDIGLGLFRYVDLVIGGLDNREARLAINEKCWKVNTPYIDGATETIMGVVRVFVPPETACYECTMNALDYKLLNQRRSCALLKRSEMVEGKVPTTPTTSSVVAGIQVQEAIKLIHKDRDLPTLAGKGFFFNGLTHDSYVIFYNKKRECPSHNTYRAIENLRKSVKNTTARELLEIFRKRHGKETTIELEHEIVSSLICKKCGTRKFLLTPLGKITEKEAKCPECGTTRIPELFHNISGKEPFLDYTLEKLGLPGDDIVTAKNGLGEFYYEFAKDRKLWRFK